MKLKLLIGFAQLLMLPLVSARIGETEEQITERYGSSFSELPGLKAGKSYAYHVGEYLVGVTFLNGVSQREAYSKLDKTDLSAEEIKSFLNKQAPQWGPRSQKATCLVWSPQTGDYMQYTSQTRTC